MNMENFKWPGWDTIDTIGSGSFGTVYEIQRTVLDQVGKAALKVIQIPKNSSDIDELYSDGYDEESVTSKYDDHLKSIIAEYNLMRKISGCNNVVRCDDVHYERRNDSIGWNIFIKMELLTSLTKSLPAVIPEATVIKMAKDICNALVWCKKYDIIHRDIKP
jgi:serine/threonine protein kinase